MVEFKNLVDARWPALSDGMTVEAFSSVVVGQIPRRAPLGVVPVSTPTQGDNVESPPGSASSSEPASPLERITGPGGLRYKPVSENTKPTKRRRVGDEYKGDPVQARCFICCKYKKKYSWTTYQCPDCGTPLCSAKQSQKRINADPGAGPVRNISCYPEHICSHNNLLRCNGVKKGAFPKAPKVYSDE